MVGGAGFLQERSTHSTRLCKQTLLCWFFDSLQLQLGLKETVLSESISKTFVHIFINQIDEEIVSDVDCDRQLLVHPSLWLFDQLHDILNSFSEH